MTIEINPETESVVREELRSGRFRSIDELIMVSVQAWKERNRSQEQASRVNGKEKAREFVKWAESHAYTPPLSDEAISRASLNPDRW